LLQVAFICSKVGAIENIVKDIEDAFTEGINEVHDRETSISIGMIMSSFEMDVHL